MKAAPRSTDLLRARLLAAMGLPAIAALASATACREAEHPAVVTDLVVTTVDGRKVESTGKRMPEDSMDMTEPRTCNRDEVLEHVCGLTAAARRGEVSIARCGEDATSIEMKEEASSLTRAGGFYKGDPGAEELKRDDALTAQVRKRARGNANSNANSLCCFSRCAAASVAAEGSPIPAGANTLLRCTPLFRAGTSVPAGADPLCAAAIDFGEGHGTAAFESRQADTCCYRAVSPRPMIIRGRPLREAGLPVLADARAQTGGWTDAIAIAIDTSNIAPRTRAELAKSFTTDAALEHASVAAFSRLALELMALGAPAHLVDRAHVAARDEIRHARVAYALASSFAGEARGPGPLPIGAASRAADLRTLVEESFVEGCVGETVAALELGEASASALACAPIASALEAMASDEASHAELAWLIVAWGLEVGGDEIARALEARATELAHAQELELDVPASRLDLSEYGVLDDATRQRIRKRAIVEVALPCARALLSSSDGSLEIQNSVAAGGGTPTCQSRPIASEDHAES